MTAGIGRFFDGSGWDLRTIDKLIEELLHSDISCSIALPRLPKRVALEDSKLLKGARVSVLDEDWDVSVPVVVVVVGVGVVGVGTGVVGVGTVVAVNRC